MLLFKGSNLYPFLLQTPNILLSGSRLKHLKKIGKILHHSGSGRPILICRLKEFIEEETKVFNEKLEEIGRMKETFGPVDHPYGKIEVGEEYEEYRGKVFVIQK